MAETLSTDPRAVAERWRAEAARKAKAAQEHLKEIIRSKLDDAPVREKMTVRHLDFYYQDGIRALRDVSLPIYANRVTALIGPSGCGKSTLLRVFNRMFSLYPGQRVEGEVLLDGKNILAPDQDVTVLRTRIGMVFQKPTPFPMSIYDNVGFGIGLNRQLSKAQLDREVEQALRRVALWDEVKGQLRKSGLDLSGGQQQRLSIARAIALKPEVLLLDEPCSAIDPISSAKIEQTIDELKHDHTIVIVTHNLQQAARVSDYAGFMYLGELSEFGAVSQIFLPPKDPARSASSPADLADLVPLTVASAGMLGLTQPAQAEAQRADNQRRYQQLRGCLPRQRMSMTRTIGTISDP